MANEVHKYPLGENVHIFTTKEYSFTTDTILLADFVSEKKHKNAIELCCGSGAISLILCRDKICNNIVAVDIQKQACELLAKSVKFNKFEGKIEIINEDLKNLRSILKGKKFETICVNPPYKKINTGFVNSSKKRALANHEIGCSLGDIAYLSSKLLNFSGSLYICNRAERLSETFTVLKNFSLEPKKLRIVQQNAHAYPKFFLLKASLGAKEGLKILPTLIMNDDNGNYTSEMKKIYGAYLSENSD